MATELDFSRAVNLNLKISKDRYFDGVLVFARDDDAAVDFGSDVLKFKVFLDNWDDTATLDWDVAGGNFTVSTATITFASAEDIDNLPLGIAKYIFYNAGTNQAVAYGDFEVI